MAAHDKQVKRAARSSRSGKTSPKPEQAMESPIGDALRSIYQQTIEEEIPQEFLDILGKLA